LIITETYLAGDGIKGIFYTELVTTAENPDKFLQVHGIKRSSAVERKVISAIKEYAKKLLVNVNKRFPHDAILEPLRIFDLHSIIDLKEDALIKHGNADLFQLEEYFGQIKLR